MDYHYTVKNGPNGRALQCSDQDLGALIKDQELFEAIQTVSRCLRDDFPPDESFQIKSGGIHSKLIQFPEKAGKTRTVAIVDYYSQRALRPLHKSLMAILKRLESDGTYSHNNIGLYAKQLTKEKSFIFCADLTAFSDRFPAIIQRELLFELMKEDNQCASALWTLLAKRTFTVAWNGDKVTYNCGQPMGAYGSWPLCSLAHHLVVEYCGRNIKDIKSKYKMIGDDIIICDEILSQEYIKVMDALNVSINYNKTVTSPMNAKHSAAEVAKQLFLNGEVLTPVTPGLMRSLKNPWLFNSTMNVLMDRYSLSGNHARLIDVLFTSEKYKQLVWSLVTNPIDGAFCRMEFNPPVKVAYANAFKQQWAAFSVEEVRTRFKLIRLRRLSKQAMKLYSRPLGGYLTSWASLAAGYLDVQNFTGGDWQHCELTLEANVLSRHWILRALFKELEKMSEIDVYLDDMDVTILKEIEYIPDPDNPFKELKDVRESLKSSLIMETLESLQSEDCSTIRDDIEVPPYLSI